MSDNKRYDDEAERRDVEEPLRRTTGEFISEVRYDRYTDSQAGSGVQYGSLASGSGLALGLVGAVTLSAVIGEQEIERLPT